MKNKNIVLIGMPASGKSTIGVILAKILGMDFVDCDLIIQKKTGKLLAETISEAGADGFIELENQVLSKIDAENSVISTGGSAVYGEDAMENLRRDGIVVYLRISFDTLKRRLRNIRQRGVVMRPGQTLRDIYRERTALYEQYADIIIDETGRGIESVVIAVAEAVQDFKSQQ